MKPNRFAPLWTTLGLWLFLSVSLQAQSAKDFVWRVSSGTDWIYLGGTIHLLRPSDYPLPKSYDVAFNDSKVLFLEANIDLVETDEIQQYVLSKGLYPESDSIKNHVKPITYRAIQQFAVREGFPANGLDQLRPWFLSNFITSTLAQSAGFDPQLGVDRHYLDLAKAQRKPLRFLETLQDEYDAFAAIPESEILPGLDGLAVAITNDETPTGQLNHFVVAWKSGLPESFDADLEKMRIDTPQSYENLIRKRNALWMPQIEAQLQSGETATILVGSLHFVGPDGLLAQLKAKGYTIDQLPILPPFISASDTSVAESGGSIVIPVMLTKPSATAVTVGYALEDVSATSGSDYTGNSGTLTFSPGVTSVEISVPITDDIVAEGNETFQVVFSNPVGAELTSEPVTVTIIDDDFASLSIDDTETSEDVGAALIVVTMSNPSATEVTVDYETIEGSATTGVDFSAASGTLTFLPGETEKTISIPIIADAELEGDETFNVVLGTVVGADKVRGTGVVTITAGNTGFYSPEAEITIVSEDPYVRGDLNSGSYVKRTRADRPFAVEIHVAGLLDPASAPPPSAAEGNVFFSVKGRNYDLLTYSGLGQDPYVLSGDAYGNRGNGDETLVPLYHELTVGDCGEQVYMIERYAADDVPAAILAQPKIEIWPMSTATLSLDPADNSQGINAKVFEDKIPPLFLTMKHLYPDSYTYAQIYPGPAVLGKVGTTIGSSERRFGAYYDPGPAPTIVPQDDVITLDNLSLDADAVGIYTLEVITETPFFRAGGERLMYVTFEVANGPMLSALSITDITVDEWAGSAVLTVSLSDGTTLPVSFDYHTESGSATASQDFLPRSGAGEIAPGGRDASISIPILDDAAVEGAESFTVVLSNIKGAEVAEETAFVTITDGGPGYDGWAIGQGLTENAGFSEDANGDGFPNSFHYAMGIPATASILEDHRDLIPRIDPTLFANKATLLFKVPVDSPDDILLEVEESFDVQTWNVIASKNGSDDWFFQGPNVVILNAVVGGYRGVGVTSTNTFSQPAPGYYRLRARIAMLDAAPIITYLYEGPNAQGTKPRGLYDFITETGVSTFRTSVPNISNVRLLSLDTHPLDNLVFGITPVDFNNNGLYTLNPNTGELSLVGTPGDQFLFTDIAFDPLTGNLFGLGANRNLDRFLVEIDQFDGSFSTIGAMLFTGTGSAGLGFSETGDLFAMFKPSASSVSTLYRMSLTDASIVEVGSSTQMNTPVDFVFSGNRLFVTDYVGKMFEIDTSDGSATEVGTLIDSRGIGGVFGLKVKN